MELQGWAIQAACEYLGYSDLSDVIGDESEEDKVFELAAQMQGADDND